MGSCPNQWHSCVAVTHHLSVSDSQYSSELKTVVFHHINYRSNRGLVKFYKLKLECWPKYKFERLYKGGKTVHDLDVPSIFSKYKMIKCANLFKIARPIVVIVGFLFLSVYIHRSLMESVCIY